MTNAGSFLEVAYIVDDFSLTVKETNKRKRGCRKSVIRRAAAPFLSALSGKRKTAVRF